MGFALLRGTPEACLNPLHTCVYVDSAATVTQDVIALSREPPSLDGAESSTHLGHTATFPPSVAIKSSATNATDADAERTTFAFRSTVTSQHGDVRPEPEMNWGVDNSSDDETAQRDKCRTSPTKSLSDVNEYCLTLF